MQVTIGTKTTNGLPGASVLADLSGLLTEDGVSFTRAALWGDLEAVIVMTGTLQDAFLAARDWLGNPVQIIAPNGNRLWTGLLWEVTFGYGARKRTRSLDGYANRTRLIYDEINAGTNPPTVTTAKKVITSNDTDQQALYGIIEYTDKPGQLVAAQASAKNARDLADRSRLLYVPDGGTLGVQQASSDTIELHCMGMWRTLQYQAYSAATTGTADVAVVIGDILTAVCPFVSTNHDQLATTGVATARQYADYDSAGDVIKRLVASVVGYTFGLDAAAVPYLRTSGTLATKATYVEQANGTIEDASGARLNLWDVQADTLLRQADFAPVWTDPLAIQNAETIYLSEVTWQAPGTLSFKAAVPGVNGEINPL